MKETESNRMYPLYVAVACMLAKWKTTQLTKSLKKGWNKHAQLKWSVDLANLSSTGYLLDA